MEMMKDIDLRLMPIRLPEDIEIALPWYQDVIGVSEFRGKGIGKRVLKLLIKRARELEWNKMKVQKVYAYNILWISLFEGLGFKKLETNVDEDGRKYSSYELILNQ